jgi:hypothetical protein
LGGRMTKIWMLAFHSTDRGGVTEMPFLVVRNTANAGLSLVQLQVPNSMPLLCCCQPSGSTDWVASSCAPVRIRFGISLKSSCPVSQRFRSALTHWAFWAIAANERCVLLDFPLGSRSYRRPPLLERRKPPDDLGPQKYHLGLHQKQM